MLHNIVKICDVRKFKLDLYVLSRVPTSSGHHGKPGKSPKKFHALKNHGILKKAEKSWKKRGILWNYLTKPQVARKLAVRHTKLVCLTASFLATGASKF